eukprot:Opistho-2@11066
MRSVCVPIHKSRRTCAVFPTPSLRPYGKADDIQKLPQWHKLTLCDWALTTQYTLHAHIYSHTGDTQINQHPPPVDLGGSGSSMTGGGAPRIVPPDVLAAPKELARTDPPDALPPPLPPPAENDARDERPVSYALGAAVGPL